MLKNIVTYSQYGKKQNLIQEFYNSSLSVLMHPILPIVAFIRKWSHVDWFTKACRWHYLRSKTPQAHKSIKTPFTPKTQSKYSSKKRGRRRRRRKLQTLQTSYMLIIFSKNRSHRKIISFLSLYLFFFLFYLFFFFGGALIGGGLHNF